MSMLHVGANTLEAYCFDRLAADEKDAVEEHLLICDQCRQRLDHEDDFVKCMKSALVERTFAH